VDVGELAPGLWWWTARHPDWRPGQSWDREVRCFYVETEDATLVIDPLVPDDDAERFWAALDRDVERRGLPVAVLLTQAAHARSSGDVAARYGAEVWGHAGGRDKVGAAAFHPVAPGDDVPGGRSLELDQEARGSATPFYFPKPRALAVGDVFISRDDGLRVWWGQGASDDSWYGERLLPSLRRWLELPLDHVLVAHGPQVEASELAVALERPPDRGE
jgi:glyoxylase-like metal-dependent hydrolase (beta-lactamase superfamily II)